MSIAGFKAQNHPQQTGVRGPLDQVDDRGTSPEVFGPLQERFGFTLDVAAAAHNAKCDRYFTLDDDGLAQSWGGERVWCNPPYSDCGAWVEKAWSEWLSPEHPESIVMLLPANRTEQGWWQDHVEPYRDSGRDGTFHVEFLRGRPRFVRPNAVIGPKGDRPPFGCCVLIWGASPSAATTDRRSTMNDTDREIRLTALDLAIRSSGSLFIEEVTGRAEAYRKFLTGEAS